jgi:hypothetical protein
MSTSGCAPCSTFLMLRASCGSCVPTSESARNAGSTENGGAQPGTATRRCTNLQRLPRAGCRDLQQRPDSGSQCVRRSRLTWPCAGHPAGDGEGCCGRAGGARGGGRRQLEPGPAAAAVRGARPAAQAARAGRGRGHGQRGRADGRAHPAHHPRQLPRVHLPHHRAQVRCLSFALYWAVVRRAARRRKPRRTVLARTVASWRADVQALSVFIDVVL